MVFEKGLRKGVKSTISILTKIWGIPGEIYAPKNYKNINTYYDEIEYEDSPILKGKLLVPFVFSQSPNMPLLYEDITDEKVLYIDIDLEIPLYSLVRIKMNNKIFDYKINEIEVINGEENYIFRKYILVPAINEVTEKEVEELDIIEMEIEDNTITDNQLKIEKTVTTKIDRIS